VEPHWGIFNADLSPKLLAWNLMRSRKFTSAGAYDGWTLSCSNSNARGCLLDRASPLLFVGADSNDRQYHAFLSFDTSELLDQALITSVKLRVRTSGIEGADPFKQGGRLIVEACRPVDGSSLSQSGSECILIGEFEGRPVNGWYILDLDPAAFAYIDLRGMTQLRLSIAAQADAELRKGYVKFYSGDAEASNRPVLIVRYDVP
jgi:hypothetical protein